MVCGAVPSSVDIHQINANNIGDLLAALDQAQIGVGLICQDFGIGQIAGPARGCLINHVAFEQIIGGDDFGGE